MTTVIVRTARALPVLLLVVVVAVVSHAFATTQSSASTDDVDVLVVTTASPLVRGKTSIAGHVDSVTVDNVRFAFAGWADFESGASLELVTSGGPTASDPRIRVRSLRRRDVAERRADPSLLYSGFRFAGKVSRWGDPKCLYIRIEGSARLVWKAPTGDCDGRNIQPTGA